jgi:pyruvate kinase
MPADAGMDVARPESAYTAFTQTTNGTAARVRQASDETGRAVGILADLQGSEKTGWAGSKP